MAILGCDVVTTDYGTSQLEHAMIYQTGWKRKPLRHFILVLRKIVLLMILRNGKLSEWEMRRYGTVAAQLLRDVNIDVQVKK